MLQLVDTLGADHHRSGGMDRHVQVGTVHTELSGQQGRWDSQQATGRAGRVPHVLQPVGAEPHWTHGEDRESGGGTVFALPTGVIRKLGLSAQVMSNFDGDVEDQLRMHSIFKQDKVKP